MTEDDARRELAERHGAHAVERLSLFVELVLAENERHNLIAPSTISAVWARHVMDSAQLVTLAPRVWRRWVDIGSGAGFPGMIIAILAVGSVTLIEPRRLRADFLERCASTLQLSNVAVQQCKAETAQIETADVISARAVAKLPALFSASTHFASPATTYLFPKGETAESEVAHAKRSWQGRFHVEHSIVDPKSGIVVAREIRPR